MKTARQKQTDEGLLGVTVVLNGSGLARKAPYPRRISGGAFEIGAAKFEHPIEYADANLGSGFLIFERACLEFGPDHGLPATH
jgi:hypothetical protein